MYIKRSRQYVTKKTPVYGYNNGNKLGSILWGTRAVVTPVGDHDLQVKIYYMSPTLMSGTSL